MQPLGFKVPFFSDESIYVEKWSETYSYEPIHYHQEYQITYITDGQGELLVGSSSHQFTKGEFFLFGKNLPHAFREHKGCIKDVKKSPVKRINILFKYDCLSPLLNECNEAHAIQDVLKSTFYGLKFRANPSGDILKKMQRLLVVNHFMRVIEFLSLLKSISDRDVDDYLHLNHDIHSNFEDHGLQRIDAIFHFILSNHRKKISLSDVAMQFNMTPPSFCRFFKSRTNKTFLEYLIELRITKACELIRNGAHNVTESCFDSGFTNISNFHRHFKKVMGMTPTDYRNTLYDISA